MSSRVSSLTLALAAALLLTPLLVTSASGPALGQATGEAAPESARRLADDQWPQDPYPLGKVDADHPYSEPAYYPLRQYMRMDCYKANPGAMCAGRDYHKEWTLTLSIAAQTGPGANAIMAMGAGVYRFVRRGNECGTASVTNFGTTVEIDHGGGVISRYGHLSNADLAKYQAMDGQLVAAGDRIGTMGLTGAVRCGEPYLNVQVERNGVLYELHDMTACLQGTAESWPQDQFPAYSRWNEVPEDDGLPDTPYTNRSFFPRMTDNDRPGTLNPANAPDQTCLPTTPPTTPPRPVAPKVDRAGSGRILVRWSGMPARTVPLVRVLYLRRSDNTWQLARTATPAKAGGEAVYVSGLQNGAKHRVVLSYRYAGTMDWSATSPVVERVVGDVPVAPAYRGVRVSGGGTALRLLWTLSKQRGFAVSGYEVAIRLRSATRWSSRRLTARNSSYLFQNLRRNTGYTVRVRALSAAGPSAWTIRNVVTRY